MPITASPPPLTGSALFDPWRLRYREQLAGAVPPSPVRRPTRSELLLWAALQSSPRTWVAEHPTRYGYTLDFFCADLRLAVEVDGPSHWGMAKRERDAWRDAVHDRLGIRTRRFSADHVERDVLGVVHEIEAFAERRAAELAGPLPAQVPAEAYEAELEEHLLLHPPEVPGWSAYLPACRTVLPSSALRRPWRELLARL